MSAIDYSDGTTAKEKVDELLNGDAAINKIKLDSSVIDCGGTPDFESAFQTLYDETVTMLENISKRMQTSLNTMKNLDNEMESDFQVGINYAGKSE